MVIFRSNAVVDIKKTWSKDYKKMLCSFFLCYNLIICMNFVDIRVDIGKNTTMFGTGGYEYRPMF